MRQNIFYTQTFTCHNRLFTPSFICYTAQKYNFSRKTANLCVTFVENIFVYQKKWLFLETKSAIYAYFKEYLHT